MKVFSRSIFAAATIVVATPVFAQQPTASAAPAQGATCEIDQGRPQPVALAMLSLTKAQTAMKGGDPTPELKAVVTRLTAPNLKNENPVGGEHICAPPPTCSFSSSRESQR